MLNLLFLYDVSADFFCHILTCSLKAGFDHYTAENDNEQISSSNFIAWVIGI
jgi:hypothetical protein